MSVATQVLLQKTGAAGTVGLNANALPASLTDDARGLVMYMGNHYEQPMQVEFTKSTQNLTLALEASLDDGSFARLAFYRLDTGALIDGTAGMTLSASATVLIEPFRTRGITAIRVAAYLAAPGAVGDTVKISQLGARS